ncbi:MAG: aminotransferase class V-fold PLP-dependent enzyme [Deltaproteobacteria bacterium]|nr:aminotransferase class V-fold PLP-dependent enzyme [Deltaproteobacteria bacterium]
MKKSALVADWNTLMRTFIRPDDERTKATLIKYMEQIQFGLHDFLSEHVGITEEVSLKELSDNLSDTRISKNPEKKLADVITDLIEDIAPHAVNITSPYFVGHMTSAIPFFMIHLKTIVAALNQNVVKLETSKVCSVLEKQVLAKIHRMIYQRSEFFYKKHVQNTNSTLGSFVECGTLANITALWVARNKLFPPKGNFTDVEHEGIQAAYHAHGVERCVVLVSRLGHYSLRKAGGLLGIGNQNIIPIDIDHNNRVDLKRLNDQMQEIDRDQGKTRILAIIGVAGATETGTIDPLRKIGEICKQRKIHFHVDAAWGGPTIMSEKYRHLFDGIEMADSITIDGHKQFYMPMGCGMVYFRDPHAMDVVAYHANYINRPGSVDLGIKSLSGSREASSLILDSALKIMGSRGYSLLYEHGIETAREFAEEINKRPLFEVITRPELNILTYRLCPNAKGMLSGRNSPKEIQINERLNEINRTVQRLQREAGNSFVSRTTLKILNGSNGINTVVLRCVIMNPMTNMMILREILDEQEDIYRRTFT